MNLEVVHDQWRAYPRVAIDQNDLHLVIALGCLLCVERPDEPLVLGDVCGVVRVVFRDVTNNRVREFLTV